MSKYIVEGKISNISVKDYGEVDNYGNQFGVFININDQWYGLGKKKKPHASVKMDDDTWYQLQEGDIIEAVASSREYKGGIYYNIKASDITVKQKAGNGGNNGGNTGNVPSANNGSNNTNVRPAMNNDDRQDAIMRQSAMGYAAQIVAATLTAKSDLDKAATDVVRLANDYFVPYAKQGITEDRVKEEELNKQNQDAQAASEEDFNDDVPF